jgi:2-oxoglutarate ferredoxin oxidoreductase subunit delta
VILIALSKTVAETRAETGKSESQKKRFKVEIDSKLCKGCYFCIRYCPSGVFSKSEEIGELGYVIAKVEHPEKCTGCRLCLIYCPDFAVSVEEDGVERR